MMKIMTRTAIIHGNSACGKSPVAAGYAAVISSLYDKDKFYMVSTLDMLPRSISRGETVVLDEYRPVVQHQMKPLSVDEIKVMLDVERGGDIYGRSCGGGNIFFEQGVPRLITNQCTEPSDFWRSIPRNLWSMSTAELDEIDADTKAILKRVAFFKVESSLIPPEVVNIYRSASSSSVSSRFDEMFAGENALP